MDHRELQGTMEQASFKDSRTPDDKPGVSQAKISKKKEIEGNGLHVFGIRSGSAMLSCGGV